MNLKVKNPILIKRLRKFKRKSNRAVDRISRLCGRTNRRYCCLNGRRKNNMNIQDLVRERVIGNIKTGKKKMRKEYQKNYHIFMLKRIKVQVMTW